MTKRRDLTALLAEANEGVVTGSKGKWPEVARALGDDLPQFEAWLDDPAGPNAAALARLLQHLGIDISESAVQKWALTRRRGK